MAVIFFKEEVRKILPQEQYVDKSIDILSSPYFNLAYIPVLNFILLVVIGRYVLSAIRYPYQNAIIRESLDRSNSSKFG
jgi:hypothetical protein